MAREDTQPTTGQDPDADVPELNPTALAPGDVAPLVDPSPRFYRDWRTGVTVAGILSLSAGAWLIASPWALDYVAGYRARAGVTTETGTHVATTGPAAAVSHTAEEDDRER